MGTWRSLPAGLFSSSLPAVTVRRLTLALTRNPAASEQGRDSRYLGFPQISGNESDAQQDLSPPRRTAEGRDEARISVVPSTARSHRLHAVVQVHLKGVRSVSHGYHFLGLLRDPSIDEFFLEHTIGQ